MTEHNGGYILTSESWRIGGASLSTSGNLKTTSGSGITGFRSGLIKREREQVCALKFSGMHDYLAHSFSRILILI